MGSGRSAIRDHRKGASVSPLLANVYLHYVLDLWAGWWRKRHARGDVIIVRWADDFIVGFEYREDAEWFLAGLRGRFAKFGLELHPDKTRLIEFGRFAARPRDASLPGSALRRHSPKVGAQCGSSARWDLCGGPPARAVPTATEFLGCRFRWRGSPGRGRWS